jgi:hypothetical protein
MKPTRHLSIRTSIAIAVAVAGLAAPAGASAWPIIGDDPTAPGAEAAGHAWMATHRLVKIKLARSVAKPKPPKRDCPAKAAGICL